MTAVHFAPGETIDENDSICGCRVVDSSKKGKAAYRIELWLKVKDSGIVDAIREKIRRVVLTSDLEPQPQPVFEIVNRPSSQRKK